MLFLEISTYSQTDKIHGKYTFIQKLSFEKLHLWLQKDNEALSLQRKFAY